jgi:Dynein heavy chain, N-terminal region 2
MDKEMRNWDTYVQLEATVKNMLTSLKAVGELQNQAIRERHWHQLMTSTKVGAVSVFVSVSSVSVPCMCSEQTKSDLYCSIRAWLRYRRSIL